MHARLSRSLAAAIIAALAVGAEAQSGGGSLLVAPTRLMFEGRSRNAELTLSNSGTATTTYRIGLTFYTMGEDGRMKEVAEPASEDRTAHALLRYSPRQVTLAPGASQTVRVSVRKPADLADGEYRSHLIFTPVPVAPSADASPQIGARLQVNVGVSIAVIVRQGATTAKATMDTPVLLPATPGMPPVLDVPIRRAGTRSLYGRLVATFQPNGGKPVEIGTAKGIGVYVPNPLRHFPLSLNLPPGLSLRSGRIEVRYLNEEKNEAPLASATLVVP